jgi:hypothetical protein
MSTVFGTKIILDQSKILSHNFFELLTELFSFEKIVHFNVEYCKEISKEVEARSLTFS